MPSKLHVAGIDGSVTDTPEYRTWINMKSRCCTPTSTGFRHYGGRGIKVCDRWLNNFEAFFHDMGPRPSAHHSLDRYPDNNGNYESGNCRWATRSEQLRNVRKNRMVTVRGRRITLIEATELMGMKYHTVLCRILRGWPVEAALTRPNQKGAKYAP